MAAASPLQDSLRAGRRLQSQATAPHQQQQQRQPPARQSSPPPAVPAPQPPASSSPHSAYTVKRFLVIPHDADDSGATMPPSVPTASPEGFVEAVLASAVGAHQGHAPSMNAADWGVSGGVANGVFEPDDELVSHRTSAASRRDSALMGTPTTLFPEDEYQQRCCFTILCWKWWRCASASLQRVLAVTLAHPLCPSTTWIARFLAMIIIGLLFLGTAIIVIGGNGWFQIVGAVVLAHVVGTLVYRATSLPPLLGMLGVGVCVRQLGYIEYFSAEHEALIYTARSAALVALMVRTGFRLDSAGVRGLSPLMVALAIVPGLVEFAVVAALAATVLGQPPLFALLSGVILAAACPSVLMPCFSLMGAGRAVEAVLVAVACLNDMVVIVVFGIFVAVIFSFAGDSLEYVLMHRVMGVGCGVLLGLVAGLLLRFIPDPHDPMVVTLRALLLGSVGIFSMLGFARIGFFGGGPAACIVVAWMSGWGWRLQGWGPDYRSNPVATVFDVLWRFMQPVMFCLIGTELELSNNSYDMNKLLLSVVVLLFAWLVRIVVSMVVTAYGDLSIKERLYVTMAWVPKAGVQAALCPLALDQARYRGDVGAILARAREVMLLVLLAVVITAPLSAALTSRRGLANVLVSDHLRRTSSTSRGSHHHQQQQQQTADTA